MVEQAPTGPAMGTSEPDTSGAPAPTDPAYPSGTAIDAPTPPPARRRGRVPGVLGVGLALVLSFVWGALAYRELGPSHAAAAAAAARVAPAVAQGIVQGSETAPAWVGDFASAFCSGDAKALADRLGPPLSGQVETIEQALSSRDWSCTDVRFLGGGANPEGTFYVYVLRDSAAVEQWWVFTTDGDLVVSIE